MTFSSEIFVLKHDGGAELDRVAGKLRNVDHLGAVDLVLDLGDAGLVQTLLLLGGVVFRILRQIAVGARFRKWPR